jgi:hypothetical protein
MNEILYQVVAVDSDLIKGYPNKVTCISQNENMANGIIYNDYDFKNHRYIKSYVSDNFNIFDKYKEQEDKINNLQSKIDKINQYLEEHFIFDDKNGEYYQTHTFDKDNAKELHDILKED